MPIKKRIPLTEREIVIAESSKTQSELKSEWFRNVQVCRKRGTPAPGDIIHFSLTRSARQKELEVAEDAYELFPNESTRTAFLIAKSDFKKANELYRQAVKIHAEHLAKVKAAQQ